MRKHRDEEDLEDDEELEPGHGRCGGHGPWGWHWRRHWQARHCQRRHHGHGFGSIVWALLLSIPFYFLWNHLAPTYLPNLPELYKDVPFWHCVEAFGLVGVVKSLLF